MKHHQLKILYIQMISYGDVLVSTAIIRKLKEKYDNCLLDYYTLECSKPMLTGNPDINKIFTERRKPAIEDYDIIFRPYQCLQKTGGWHLSGKHFMDLYAEACGISLDGNYQTYFYNMGEKVLEGKYILIQCKTNDSAKDYSRFPELVNSINQKIKIPVVQIGSKNEPIILNTRANLLGRTAWPATARLIKDAVVTICLDSAVQHLAASLDALYIALYGAKESRMVESGHPIKNPELWQSKQVSLNPSNRNGCEQACYMAQCANPKGKCIDNIDPEEIIMLIDKVIGA